MARIVPVKVSVCKSQTGKNVRVTIPIGLREDSEFRLDLTGKKQLYMRIVEVGVLITHDSNGGK